LVAGPVTLPTPPGVKRVDVKTAAEMAAAILPFVKPGAADAIVMNAAVADYTPKVVAARKLKKAELDRPPQLTLVPTLDILAELGRQRGRRRQPLLVGFAAETHAVEEYAVRKLREKRCDVIVANDVAEPGSGFGSDNNRVTVFAAAGPRQPPQIFRLPLLPKEEVASRLWEHFTPLFPAG